MSTKVYVVRQGDYVSKIAHRFGVKPDDIWDHPKNADLAQKRGSPHVLHPGDLLFIEIPDEAKGRKLNSQTQNSYNAEVPLVPVKVVLVDELGKPLAGKPCYITGGHEDPTEPKTSGGGGELELLVPVTTRELTIVVDDDSDTPLVRKVWVGDLDPAVETSGLRDRLRLLGYYPDEVGVAGGFSPSVMNASALAHFEAQKLRNAVVSFQTAKSLKVTGEVDESTLAALKAEFGN